MKHTGNTKKSDLGAFFRVFFSFFILGVAFFGFFGQAKIAQGANDYVDDVYIWLDEHLFWRLHFHVKTTFTITYSIYPPTNPYREDTRTNPIQTSFAKGCFEDYYTYGANPTHYWHAYHSGAFVYQAGNSYDEYLTRVWNITYSGTMGRRTGDLSCNENDYNCSGKLDNLLNAKGGILLFNPPVDYTFTLTDFSDMGIQDNEEYPVIINPILSITFPNDNAEIAGAFNIKGNYGQLDLERFNLLIAEFRNKNNDTLYFFKQKLNTAPTGEIDLKVSGIPAGDYNLYFYFHNESYTGSLYFPPYYLKIKIVDDIPYQLPITEEIPPDYFSIYSAGHIYTEYSNYATPTAMFSTLTGAIEPIITTLGDNLTFFTSQFSQSKAKQTGESIGQAILIVRAYANNLNSFFNDLPIAQVLFFYILLLIVVVVFRIIRQAISLIPFT